MQFEKKNSTTQLYDITKACAGNNKEIGAIAIGETSCSGLEYRERSHPAKLPTCERKRPKDFSTLRKQQQTKAEANMVQAEKGPFQADSRTWQCLPCGISLEE